MKSLIFVITLSALISCSRDTRVTGVTETGNTEISGVLQDPNGVKLAGVEILLIPEGINGGSVMDSVFKDTTNSEGKYSIALSDTGNFNIYAIDKDSHYQGLVTNIYVSKDTVIDLSFELKPPGALSIPINSLGLNIGDSLIIEGVGIVSIINKNSIHTGVHIIPNLPEGDLPNVIYSSIMGKNFTLIQENKVSIISSDTTYVTLENIWNYKRSLEIKWDSNLNVNDSVLIDFPWKLVLDNQTIKFGRLPPEGTGISFVDDNGKIIPYEIELWDVPNKFAVFWLLIDTLQFQKAFNFKIYYGLNGMGNNSNSEEVFKTSNGFVGVWHMSPNNKDFNLLHDGTNNKLNGTFENFPELPFVAGKAGMGVYFDGKDDHIVVKNVPKLNFGTGDFTLSAIANPDTLFVDNQIVCKRIEKQGNYEFQVNGQGAGKMGVYFAQDSTNSDSLEGATEIKTGEWVHLTVVRENGTLYLYQNGKLETQGAAPQNVNSQSDLIFGMDSGFRKEFFRGIIDEIRISNVARSPEWVYLTSQNLLY